jgi:hypothetical protein
MKSQTDMIIHNATKEALGTFATTGLRTLLLAKQVIPQNIYQAWRHQYNEVVLSKDPQDFNRELALQNL